MSIAPRLSRCVASCGALAVVVWLLTAASAQATHPRPKSATPLRMPLVPAYAACAAPNRTHGPPLAFASCNPPTQTSAQATVGTPDAFGGAASSASYIRLEGFPSPLAVPDESDIFIEIALNDARCVPSGARCGSANTAGPADYMGDMRFSLTFGLTDHFNAIAAGGGTDAATVQDFAVDHSWACAETGSTSIGSTCNLFTTLRVLIPEAPRHGTRMVWSLEAARIYDGGADGDGDTTPGNTTFARPGVFIP